jgi:hypothetical protein
MRIGVIEWASDSLREPTVYVSFEDETEGILRWAASEIQGYTFDDGGPIDQHRDTYSPNMSYRQLARWHEDLWEMTTEAWVGVYQLADAEGETILLHSGGNPP